MQDGKKSPAENEGLFPTYLLTYLLTPWCRVLLVKLTGLQLVKKFTAFHGTRRFITALTSVRHLSLPWASPIQSIYSHPTSWRSILILSTHLRQGLPSGLFPSGFPTKTLYTPISSPIRAACQSISLFSILSHAQYWVKSTFSYCTGEFYVCSRVFKHTFMYRSIYVYMYINLDVGLYAFRP